MPVPFSSLRRLRQTRVCTFSSTMATLDVKGYAASWRVFQFGCCRCESYYTCWSPLIRAKTASGPKASPTKPSFSSMARAMSLNRLVRVLT